MSDQKIVEPVKEIQAATRAESEPAPVRRYRAVMFQTALVLAVAAFGVLTFLVVTIPFFAIDLQITKTIQQINLPFFTPLMSAISWPGFTPQSIVITLLIAGVIYISGLHWESVMALAASAFSTTLNLVVKDLVHRPRPTPDLANVYSTLTSYSFPSGHVMFYFGFFGFVCFLAFTLLKPSIKRTFILVFFGSLIFLIGISRIALGQHWASDVLGAYLLGGLTLVVIVEVYRWGKTRFFVHQPVAAAQPEKK